MNTITVNVKAESPKVAFCKAYGVDPNRVIGMKVDETGMVTFTVVGELQPDEK